MSDMSLIAMRPLSNGQRLLIPISAMLSSDRSLRQAYIAEVVRRQELLIRRTK